LVRTQKYGPYEHRNFFQPQRRGEAGVSQRGCIRKAAYIYGKLIGINSSAMNRFLILTFIVFLPGMVHSQGYINLTKAAAQKMFAKYNPKENFHTNINETDSTLSFSIRDPKVQNLDLVLNFDDEGRCQQEQTILACDSCYLIFINHTLADGRYKWKRIYQSTWFSTSRKRLILTTVLPTPFSYSIRRSSLIKQEYKQAIKNASSN
jgi:hypothetical protein